MEWIKKNNDLECTLFKNDDSRLYYSIGTTTMPEGEINYSELVAEKGDLANFIVLWCAHTANSIEEAKEKCEEHFEKFMQLKTPSSNNNEGNNTGEYTNNMDGKHYQNNGFETIEKIHRVFGTEHTVAYCYMQIMRYSDRIGLKKGEPVEKELSKIKWYREKAKELKMLIERGDHIEADIDDIFS